LSTDLYNVPGINRSKSCAFYLAPQVIYMLAFATRFLPVQPYLRQVTGGVSATGLLFFKSAPIPTAACFSRNPHKSRDVVYNIDTFWRFAVIFAEIPVLQSFLLFILF